MGSLWSPKNRGKVNVLLRIARDLHFYDIAQGILATCQRLAETQRLGESARTRLEGVGIGLRLATVEHSNLGDISSLLEDSRVHCERVIEEQDELFTPASCFTQIAGLYQRSGGVMTAQNQAFLEKMFASFDKAASDFLMSMSAPFPTAENVLTLYNRLRPARNSEDVPSDQASVVVAAQRLLLPRAIDISAVDAAMAIELLSEWAIELPGPSNAIERGWPASFAGQLSLDGLAVLMLAMDEMGELVTVVVEDGVVTTRRPQVLTVTFNRRLAAWSGKYPYRYGLIERDEGNSEFYSTMSDFDVPMPNSAHVLVIAQPALAPLAFNLVLANGDLSGYTKAIAVAPSLTWFNSSRQRPLSKDERRIAWISVAPEPEKLGTMDMVYQRLLPVFEKHQFQVDTSRRIPALIQGARLAVVTAHGQLTADERYIYRIVDEENLTESPVALARALAEVELVILFVCSGGRVDQHPHANTSVSLPKMLLDRGCRTAIASPWPLAAVVLGHWLERFLELWETGATALEANYQANLHVCKSLGPEPQLCLAMTVYGDALLRKH